MKRHVLTANAYGVGYALCGDIDKATQTLFDHMTRLLGHDWRVAGFAMVSHNHGVVVTLIGEADDPEPDPGPPPGPKPPGPRAETPQPEKPRPSVAALAKFPGDPQDSPFFEVD